LVADADDMMIEDRDMNDRHC